MTDQIVAMIGIAVLVGLGIAFTVFLLVLRPKLGALPTVPPNRPNIAPISVEEVIDSFPPFRERYVRLWRIRTCNAWIAELADENGDVVMLEDGTPLRFGKPNNTAVEALFSLRKYLLDNRVNYAGISRGDMSGEA